MKKLCSLLLFTCAVLTSGAQIKVGQSVNNTPLVTVLNAPVKHTDLFSQKGKVVLIEFWATWCGSCIEVMPHLQALQKQFGDKLQVITVSTEQEKRIAQFIVNRPSNLWFAVDTADALRKDFPYHTIPHTILIDPQGVVVAISQPENITEKVIADVVAGLKISLPLKEDNLSADPWKTYFSAKSEVQSRFLIQPQIAGLYSGSKTYGKAGGFSERRISIMNHTVEGMYRIAYGNFPSTRYINLIPKEEKKENEKMYCVDVIVPVGKESTLLPVFRAELKNRFDLQATVEKRLKTVYVLKIVNMDFIAKLVPSKFEKMEMTGRHGAFDGKRVTFSKIAGYLEDFGITGIPVVDETSNNKLYDISFNYMPEKKGDYLEELRKLGLDLVKTEREIDMLIFK